MRIHSAFDVAQPLDEVWRFFDDVPQVAACLPGADLTEELGDDTYGGTVAIRMGPVRLQFAGTAAIVERDEADRRIVVDASGADEKGRGQAAMEVTARLSDNGGGTTVSLDQDLKLSGAAAQYGRGMVADVTSVLMDQFATTMQARMQGDVAADPQAASGLAIGLRALRMALARVARRFFLPYRPEAV